MSAECGPEHHRCSMRGTIGSDSLHFESCPNHGTECLNFIINILTEDRRSVNEINRILRSQNHEPP